MLKKLLIFALHSLRARKLRSWLTVLGIVIGVASVVGLMLIGNGLQKGITQQFEKAGVNKILVTPGKGAAMGMLESEKLSEHDLDLIKKTKGVEKAAGIISKYGRVSFKKQNEYTFIIGTSTDTNIEDIAGVELEKGKQFSNDDSYEAIIGYRIAQGDFFEQSLKPGNKITIQNKEFEIIGTLEEVGNSGDDSQVYIPIKPAKSIFNEKGYSMIIVKTKEGHNTKEVAEEIKEKMRKDRNLKKGEENFSVRTFEQLMQTFGTILNIVQVAIIGIAAISLIVGGVGIMNTMYTSIIERTKQIGVMKAIGAKDKHILSIFIIESGIIGLTGGIIGTLIGFAMAKSVELVAAANGFSMLKVNFDMSIILIGLLFAIGIGILSGILPAYRASKLDPVEALRWG